MVWPKKLAEPLLEKFVGGPSVMDLRHFWWRLVKAILDLERGRLGEHRHVFVCQVWVGGKIRV
jgi:hypothetical protein